MAENAHSGQLRGSGKEKDPSHSDSEVKAREMVPHSSGELQKFWRVLDLTVSDGFWLFR